MRLKSLTVENVTSLKGIHVIEFDRINGHSDLFAITGPTGSGKSSLLSAISLALFGKTIKQNLNAADFISTGESAAAVELIFHLGRKEYIATWYCSIKKKNGDLRVKPQIIRKLIEKHTLEELQFEQLIDLDFNQFHKVAILNQGRFADFLHASFTERKELLETLIGDNEILEIGKGLKTIIGHYNLEIEKLETQSSHATLLSQEEKKELTSITKKITNEKNILEQKINNFSALSQNIEASTDLKSKDDIVKQRVINEKNNYELLLKQLRDSKILEEKLNSKYQAMLNQFKETLPKLQSAIDLNKKISTTEHNKEKLFLEIKNHKSNIQSLADKNSELHAKIKEMSLLYESKYISYRDKALSQIEQELNVFEKYVANSVKIKEIESQIVFLSKNESEYKSNINEKNKQILDLNKDSPTHLKNLNEISTRIKAIEILIEREDKRKQNQFKLSEEIKQKSKLLKENIDFLEAEEDDYEICISKSQNLSININKLKKIIKEEKETDLIIQNYKELVKRYDKDHKSCHVCQSPIDQETYKQKKNKIIDYEKNSNECIDVNILESLKDNFNELSTKSKHQAENINKYKLKIASYKKEITILDKELSKLIKEIPKDNFQKELNELRKLEQIIPEWNREIKINKQKLDETLSTINDLQKSLKVIFEDQNKIISSNENLNKDDITQDSLSLNRQLVSEYKVFLSELNSIHVNIKSNQSDISEATKKLTSIEPKFKELDQEVKSLEEEYNNQNYPLEPQKQIDLRRFELDELKNQLHNSELKRREHDNACQKKDSLIRTLNEQTEEHNKLILLYYSKFKKEQEISLKLHEKEIENHLSKINQWYLDTNVSLSNFSIEALLTLKNDIFDQNFNTLSQTLDDKIKENTVALTRLQENSKQEEKITSLIEKKKILKNELSDYLDLEQYIGKDRFRDYALSVIEKNLLVLANKEILQLADGRYKILHAKEGKRSEFIVQDKWKAESTRKVSTLSGGETFMLSLGLSLALSNLNRGSQEIGFFLIDEGFGTLDQDSINDVLECLMGLRSRGKQIGIISHVKELTSRIPVNIELSKNQWGESTLDTLNI